jgi:hypothetical protein
MRKVVILGTAPLSKDKAPFDDPSYEIWVCSGGNMGSAKRVTHWFELHALVELNAPENQGWCVPYMEWLRKQPFPVWMLEPNDLVPQHLIFPARELLAEFGREWFTSSIAWMIAFAVAQKVDEIAIFGVDMASDHEYYTTQRAGCRRWIEIAQGRGIKVTIPWDSCLGNPPPIYGLSEATPFGRRVNVTETLLQQQRVERVQQEERAKQERIFFDGALEQLRYFKRTFLDGSDCFQHIVGLPPAMKSAADVFVEAMTPKTVVMKYEPAKTPIMEPSLGSKSLNGGGSHPKLVSPPPVDEKTHGRARQGRTGVSK